jgi:hypothetical protein
MNTVAGNDIVTTHIATDAVKLEKARFNDLLDETFARTEPQKSESRVPGFYPSYRRVHMSINAARSHSSDASVMLKLRANRYTLSVT